MSTVSRPLSRLTLLLDLNSSLPALSLCLMRPGRLGSVFRFPALMPVENPCRLHVALHPRQPPTSDMATCLLDMRRVVQAPVAPWLLVELPALCVLSDVQGLLHALYPANMEYGAVYINYQCLGTHPIGVHRHTVVTVLGMSPREGLDTVYGDGSFGPLCFRGNDVAATRPGLAQFLAYPAHVGPAIFTSTTTTNGPPLDMHTDCHADDSNLRTQLRTTFVKSHCSRHHSWCPNFHR